MFGYPENGKLHVSPESFDNLQERLTKATSPDHAIREWLEWQGFDPTAFAFKHTEIVVEYYSKIC